MSDEMQGPDPLEGLNPLFVTALEAVHPHHRRRVPENLAEPAGNRHA